MVTNTQLQAIVWDVDGVIADTEDFHRQAYNALFAEQGSSLRWSMQDYADRLAVTAGRKFAEIMELLNTPPGQRPAQKQVLYDRKTELFCELFARATREGSIAARPGVIRLMRQARRANIKLAAASTSRARVVIQVLSLCLGEEMLGWFQAVCAEDDAANKKPAPDIYLLAARKLGVEPASCVAIEDTTHGMHAALAAGMRCIITPGEYTRQDDFAGADLVVEDLDRGPTGPVALDTLGRLIAAPN